ncbi:MAG TPA: methyltransferase domain-containing protein [Kofleriaceae bacterium]|nr:methyltransferase domain-containing protein [Kofleriaceae bacterium]
MFGSFFIAQTVQAISEALGATDGRVVVIDWPRAGKALADSGLEVVQVSGKPRSLRRHTGARLYADGTRLPLADGCAAAVVAGAVSTRADREDVLGEYQRVVRDGGSIVLIDRQPATELTRFALCGGLAEIEQRHAGRTVVTSGQVIKL